VVSPCNRFESCITSSKSGVGQQTTCQLTNPFVRYGMLGGIPAKLEADVLQRTWIEYLVAHSRLTVKRIIECQSLVASIEFMTA